MPNPRLGYILYVTRKQVAGVRAIPSVNGGYPFFRLYFFRGHLRHEWTLPVRGQSSSNGTPPSSISLVGTSIAQSKAKIARQASLDQLNPLIVFDQHNYHHLSAVDKIPSLQSLSDIATGQAFVLVSASLRASRLGSEGESCFPVMRTALHHRVTCTAALKVCSQPSSFRTK